MLHHPLQKKYAPVKCSWYVCQINSYTTQSIGKPTNLLCLLLAISIFRKSSLRWQCLMNLLHLLSKTLSMLFRPCIFAFLLWLCRDPRFRATPLACHGDVKLFNTLSFLLTAEKGSRQGRIATNLHTEHKKQTRTEISSLLWRIIRVMNAWSLHKIPKCSY